MRTAFALVALTVATSVHGVRIYAIGVKTAPLVTSADIVRSSVRAFSVYGHTGVAFKFTKAGRTKFRLLTLAVAQRGVRLHHFAHFAIAINGRVYATPYVDYTTNPKGIDSPTAELETTSLAKAQRLAALMRAH
jgi:hypothetical protein